MHREHSNEPTDSREVWSVSELNQQLKHTIAGNFPLVWVEGEISNLARPASGHIYFSLKDNKAQLRCVMFRNSNMRVPFEIDNGLQVVIRAAASVYEARGDLQLIVDSMEEAGFGALQRQFEALKKKLFKEGLFDEANKKPIPQYPKEIAIITSPSGAAIKDYLNVAQRRFPSCKKTIYSVAVQGEKASQLISRAIKAANKHACADVIVLIRGGGSIEDLWCFNDEQLARSIAASNLPIVTGIGHEIDYTIVDFVADVRAPTPSVAAELTCPDSKALYSSLLYSQQLIHKISIELVNKFSQNIDWLAQRLLRNHPTSVIDSQKQQLTNLSTRLITITKSLIKERVYKSTTIMQRHLHQSPKYLIGTQKNTISELSNRLALATKYQLEHKRHKLQLHTATMHAVSPLQTLNRGYSITVDKLHDNRILTNTKGLKQGDQITTYLAKGEIVSTVKSTSSNNIVEAISNINLEDN